MVCRGSSDDGPHLCQSADRRGVKVWIWGPLPIGELVGGVDLQVTSVHPIHLRVTSASYTYAVPVCSRPDLTRVVDLCCGLGGFTHMLDRVGLQLVCGVDQNQRWEPLFTTLHPGAKFLHGDINEPRIIRDLTEAGCFHGIMCAGISCNAHSTMGDQMGMADPRSRFCWLSLPKALQTGYMLQSACFVLECTPAIMQDREARAIIRQFAAATGYKVSQSLIQLARSWCSRRERWFGLFCAPLIGPCVLQNLPELDVCPRVSDLLTEVKVWPKFEQTQIELNLYELSKYHAYTNGGIQAAAYLNTDGKLPTLLHSAGNALYTCACGCRAALSESRLKSRGLVGVLVPLGTTQVHMNIEMEHCRYLHPQEMWCLMGGLPGVPFGHNMRLAMCGIGQCVSPLVGVWIFAQIKQHLESFLDVPLKLCPFDILKDYVHEVKTKCLQVWPTPVPPTMVEEAADESPSRIQVHVQLPLQSEAIVEVNCMHGTTGAQLLEAETKIGSLDFEPCVTHDGLPLDMHEPLKHGVLVSVMPVGWDCKQEPVVHVPFGPDDLAEPCQTTDTNPGLRYDVPVTSLGMLGSLRGQDQLSAQRIAILAPQGPVWSDDELLFWLNTTAAATDQSQNVQVWDPLLVSGLVVSDVVSTWKVLTDALGVEATVVSAVVIDRHWYPVVWRFDSVGSKLFTCGVPPDHALVFQAMTDVVNQQRGSKEGEWSGKDLGFVVTRHCGAMAIAFVRHLLVEARMPSSQTELDVLASELRVGFERCLPPMCHRPRLAGLGLVDHGALQDLLVAHGVSGAEAKSRARSLLGVLGEPEVARALQCSNPWKELKWLANQQRPPVQIVKPSELQLQVQKRQGLGTVGNKKHKSQKGKGKGKGSAMIQTLDPTRLRVDHGLLQSQSGQPLSQVTLPQVGSTVSGVVLTTLALAGPYIQSCKVVSTGALAFFVVDSVQPISGLTSAVETLPLVCVPRTPSHCWFRAFLSNLGPSEWVLRSAPLQHAW